MLFIFKTKTDVNGNTYYLVIDTEKKQFKRGYNMRLFTDSVIITVSKKERREIIEKLYKNGFTETE